MEEIWRDIKGYEEQFQVSNKGHIFDVTNNKIVNSFSNSTSKHRKVNLKQHKYYVHRLVAFAFPEICGEYFEGAECNHKDENPENNIAENLEWVTHRYNNQYGTKGIRQGVKISKGAVVQIKDNEIIDEFTSAERAGKYTGISANAIRGCCNNKYGYKTAGGFVWKFKNNVINVN